MNAAEVKTVSPVQWDTCSNKVYFNVEKGSLQGRLIITKTSDGKIGMHIVKNESLPGGRR
jgi:hypothetical protein